MVEIFAGLVVKCTGFGSLKRGGVVDKDGFPAREQVVVRDHPNTLIARFQAQKGTEDADTCVIQGPQLVVVVLGGTYRSNNWDAGEADLKLGKRIM